MDPYFSFDLGRGLFIKGLLVCHFIAFTSLGWQVTALLGDQGIVPVGPFLGKIKGYFKQISKQRLWFRLPTWFWFYCTDSFIRSHCLLGAGLSVMGFVGWLPVWFVLLINYFLYLSLLVVGVPFLSFQWDSMLLEMSILGIILCWFNPIPIWVGFLLWIVVFKLFVSSGFLKLLSGDKNWRSLTALRYYFETQPLPNKLAWYCHQLPGAVLSFGTFLVLIIECVLPFFILFGDGARVIVGCSLILFQVLIFLTGNFGFFNLLVGILCVGLFSDSFWLAVVPSDYISWFLVPVTNVEEWQLVAAIFVVLVLIVLNLVQILAVFFNSLKKFFLLRYLQPFFLCNNYGLFMVITTKRFEWDIEVSINGEDWESCGFRYKPMSITKPPNHIAPYHPRFDWQFWFASLDPQKVKPWVEDTIRLLLQGSEPVKDLFGVLPFGGQTPKFARMKVYQYHFTSFSEKRGSGHWWKRDERGETPVISLSDFDTQVN